ncbi:MAG: RICIN domain-containing protein, partial [Chitinophagaceae bacterium]
HLGSNVYTIQAVHSKRFLSSNGQTPTAGSNIIQWDWVNQDNQKWIIKKALSGNGYIVTSWVNELNVIVENYGAVTASPKMGSPLKLISNSSLRPMTIDFIPSKNQLNSVEDSKINHSVNKMQPLTYQSTKIDIANGTYKIQINETGKYLAIAGEYDRKNGAKLIQWDMLKRTNHYFKINKLPNGNYTISAAHSNKVLDVVDKNTADGTQIQQWDFLNSDNQEWQFYGNNQGNLSIISVASNKRLQLSTGINNSNNGIPLIINKNSNQTFKLIAEAAPETTEIVTLSNLRFSVPNGGDLDFYGQIEVFVIDKNGSSFNRYYASPLNALKRDNLLFYRPESAPVDMNKERIKDFPVTLKFAITHNELQNAKIYIVYSLNEDDADVNGITGAEPLAANQKEPSAARMYQLNAIRGGGNDDFYVLKGSLNDCLNSTINKPANTQMFYIQNIPSKCISHCFLQDEDGSKNYIDIWFTLSRETVVN